MDLSNINVKESLGKLKFLADYSALIVPIIITVIAVVIIILTPILMGNKLQESVEKESVAIGKRVATLSKTAVSSSQGDVEEAYQKAYALDANAISQMAVESSQRLLLSYKIFPEPKDRSALIFEQFAKRFRSAVEAKLAGVKSSDCPTEAEFERHLQGNESVGSSRRRSSGGRNDSVSDAIKNVLCEEKAQESFVYANPSAISGYEAWDEYSYTGVVEDTELCWYWQVGYWIIEDVIDSIGAANAGTENVFSSGVKRLLDISFMPRSKSSSRGKGKKENSLTVSDEPDYVSKQNVGLVTPYTKRVGDSDIDVLHFNVSVVVSSKALSSFMEHLCSAKVHEFRGFDGKAAAKKYKHNQITILSSNILPVEADSAMHELYRYGTEDAVVQLDLICEYIFNKSGYSAIKPATVKAITGEGEKKSSGRSSRRRGRRR